MCLDGFDCVQYCGLYLEKKKKNYTTISLNENEVTLFANVYT